MTALGIIAGGGDLPIAIAECASEAGKRVFVAALRGIAGREVERFPHEWVSLGQTGRTLSLFRQQGCDEVLFAGKVTRPRWADIQLDATAVMKLPKVMAAAIKGDDALLRSFVSILEEEGFRVVSATEAAPALLAPAGVMGRHRPSSQDEADIALGARVVSSLGALDVGQAAIVSEGLVLAVEAAEGTDAMISRVCNLAENLHGTLSRLKGVLVKSRKPTQDGKTDLPVVGVDTVRKAAAAALAGIAVEAGGTLIINRQAVVSAADQAGIFLVGFPASALRRSSDDAIRR